MGTTRKVLRKVAGIIETTPGTYLAPDTLFPRTEFTLTKTFDMVIDESIVGEAFPGLPNQGVRKIEGTLAGEVDSYAFVVIAEAGLGAVSSNDYYTPTDKNEKSISLVAIDGVKTVKFAGCFMKSLAITSSAEGKQMFSADLVGYTNTVRDDTAFPAMSTTPRSRFMHHSAGGTNGYFRIGDQADALDSGDNICVSDFEITVNWNFDNQFASCSQGTLIPLSGGAGRPEITFSFTDPRHDDDNYFTWRDALTALQFDAIFYTSATANIRFRIPNFVISNASISDDEIGNVPVETAVARNGISTNYDNSNMAFNDVLRVTIVNS